MLNTSPTAPTASPDAMPLAAVLNTSCMCRTLDADRLRAQLETDPTLHGMAQSLQTSHPHLFSQSAVFLDNSTRRQLEQAIAALESVIALPAYQQHVLPASPAIAAHHWGPVGVLMGYDFHLGADGPRLIEINTNAGGAWLNAALARAHLACCDATQFLFEPPAEQPPLEQTLMAMFRQEWQAQRGTQPWRNVLIVDDSPTTQYLAPEFELARAMFARHGLEAVVADPISLQWRDGALWHPMLPPDQCVDMVYNRLTDFDLRVPTHTALRAAYEAGVIVLTPHPRAHALHADKRNLATLGDQTLLQSWGVPEAQRTLLAATIPHTVPVNARNADALWAQRRQLFFKPTAGYGAKAAYRGDKLTRRVWDEICAGGFIAQTLVPPSERLVEVDGTPTRLKVDVRAYTYRGEILLLAARTYMGQTTNMRTPGGGFSPVVVVPDLALPPGALSPSPAPVCAC